MCRKYSLILLVVCLANSLLIGQTKEQTYLGDYMVKQLVATDEFGRRVNVVDVNSTEEKYVGVFYSVWLGQHQQMQKGIFDIQKLLNTAPEVLNDTIGSVASPKHQFHFSGEPLYGYYSMSDPWIVTRHIELLTNASIDYLCIDATNNVVYEDATYNLLDHLLKFQKQGFAVPKVVFYTNSNSGVTVDSLYNKFYKSGNYETLWFRPTGKPMIIGITEANAWASDQTRFEEILHKPHGFQAFIKADMKAYFDVRESQWPNGEFNEKAIPWMSWQNPQWNHKGSVAVPVAQHSHSVIYASSLSPECSRGYNNKTNEVEANWKKGANFQTKWDYVLESKEMVNNVLVTSFNEWMAIKYVNEAQEVFFVDVYNHEYSRDIEMMKGGYNDNFYLQLVQNVRKFKFKPRVSPEPLVLTTFDIRYNNEELWSAVNQTYVDFAGDARSRHFENASGDDLYTDNSNRNDIVEIKVAHDEENIYFRIKALDDISPYNGHDINWMNILLSVGSVDESFSGYNFIVNRKPDNLKTSVEISSGGYKWDIVGEAAYHVQGNAIQLAIPLAALGLTADQCKFEFKVSDNVTNSDDIMDYYISGDVAPLGRLGFAYGF